MYFIMKTWRSLLKVPGLKPEENMEAACCPASEAALKQSVVVSVTSCCVARKRPSIRYYSFSELNARVCVDNMRTQTNMAKN